MKVKIAWINPSAEGRSILLSKASVLANGMRTMGAEAGFVTVATKEQQKAFNVGDEVELPPHAKVVMAEFRNKDTGEVKTMPAWQY